MVFLKVSPMKGTIRFGQKRKLSPRYVGSFEIRSRVKDLAYRLILPPDLAAVHDVFHMSMLRRYVPDLSHVIEYEPLEIRTDATYDEKPLCVIDIKELVLLPRRYVGWRSCGSTTVRRKPSGS